MNVGAALVGLSLALFVAILLIDPYLANKRSVRPVRPAADRGDEIDKKATLEALRDLDFDFETGKVLEQDYLVVRAELIEAAAKALEAEDQNNLSVESLLERKILQMRRSRKEGLTCTDCGQSLVEDDRFCSNCGAQAEKACPLCSKPVQTGDEFCSHCGARLNPRLARDDEKAS